MAERTKYGNGKIRFAMTLAIVWLLASFATGGVSGQESELISQTAWHLKATSSFNAAFKKTGDYAFDGQPGTLWESASQVPATLDIDLGHIYDVKGFAYLPRQEGPWGRIKKYSFYVSHDGSSWGSPVSTGDLLKDMKVQHVRFAKPETGRYVRLEGLAKYAGSGISVAELNILGTLSSTNTDPVVTITSPARYFPGLHVYEPASFNIRAIASTKNDEDPVQVSFYSNSELLGVDTTAPFSWDVSSATAGLYQFVAKAKYRDDTEATSQKHDFEVRSAAHGIPMDRKNWKLQFVDSWKPRTDVGKAPGHKSFDDNPFTWWVTQWEPPNNTSYPHVIEIDMGKSYSIGGFLALPPQDPGTWGTLKDYEFYTSTDGRQWGDPVAKGTFVYPTAYMQKEQGENFPFVDARYVKLKILSGYNTKNQVLRIAEINVLKKVQGHE